MKLRSLFLAAAAALAAASAHASIQITEWMYSGPGGEFIEFTNLGNTPVSFAGYVYDDDSRINTVAGGGFDLSAFGTVAPGESVILTESTAASFRASWALAASVKVIGGYTNNLGRTDEINLFDASGALVDRLTYSDVTFAGTVRTQDRSGTPLSLADLVPTTVTTGWVLSSVGDAFGSYAALGGDIGNPGQFALAVPEPGTVALWLAGLAGIGVAGRRRRKQAAAAAALLAVAATAQAQGSIGLQNYGVSGNVTLPVLGGLGLEASAVTFARDRGTLFIVGDEGLGVVELTLSGQFVGSMAFDWAGTGSSNNDAEGLTYLGNGQLVVVDERPQIAYRFTYASGGSVALAGTPRAAITGSTASVGNVGTEGISFDPRDGSFVSVKQDNPLELRAGSLAFNPNGGSSTMGVLFTGASALFGVNSFSDVQTLSPVDAFAGQPAADNLLILSLDSRRLIEINRQGQTLSSLDLTAITPQAIEGVTVDNLGTIYLVAEDSGTGASRLITLSPVPEPGTWALMALGLAAVGLRARRG
jgi:uncharacterized protein YjiK